MCKEEKIKDKICHFLYGDIIIVHTTFLFALAASYFTDTYPFFNMKDCVTVEFGKSRKIADRLVRQIGGGLGGTLW